MIICHSFVLKAYDWVLNMKIKQYAGDISPLNAWNNLKEDVDAVLIDVRTDAEWEYVGIPDLSSLNKKPILVAWVSYPGNRVNADFINHIRALGITADQKIFCLCRSGQRSVAAAIALKEAGFNKAFNILEGFEGDKNKKGQRGLLGGWKMRGLPWGQK